MGKYLRALAQDEIYRRGPALKPGPSLLLLVIADRVRDDTGILFASERNAAAWIGRSQSTYRKWRSQLEDAGLLIRDGEPLRGEIGRFMVLPNGARPVDQPRVIPLDDAARQRLAEAHDQVNTGGNQ